MLNLLQLNMIDTHLLLLMPSYGFLYCVHASLILHLANVIYCLDYQLLMFNIGSHSTLLSELTRRRTTHS